MKRMLLALILVLVPLSAEAQEFPVTVDHIYGATTVSTAPKRIVSVGMHEQDFLYALGLSPVGVKEWWGDHPYATWPWAEDERAALGATPAVMDTKGINLEWVLAQNPDLIIAIYVNMDETIYAELSKIAPTVVTPAGYEAWGAPWQAELRIIDRATTGSTAKSDAIIAGFDQRYADIRATYPQLAGKTGTNFYYDPISGGFTAWGSGDLASKFLIDLGLVFPPALDAMAQADNRIDVSAENIALIDTDIAIFPLDDPQTRPTVEGLPTWQSLRLAKEGRAVWLDDGDGLAYAAMSWQTPLSLGYLLDVLPPALAAAADGDPTTPVASFK